MERERERVLVLPLFLDFLLFAVGCIKSRWLVMKVTSVSILRWNGTHKDPYMLGTATDLNQFNYFQRGSVKEMLVFTSRTIAQRTPEHTRQSVEHQEYVAHVHNRGGLVGIVFVDREYPTRSAFSLLNRVLDEYNEKFGESSWRRAGGDGQNGNGILEEALVKYQDPAQADKLLKVQKELDETKIVLHKTIDSVLDRGEKLNSLVEKSTDLSMASQMFYKQARKQNQCCTIM